MKFLDNKGQILPITIFLVGLILANSLVMVGQATTFFFNSSNNIYSDEAENIAEAGVDKALASLDKNPGGYLGETNTSFGAGVFSVNVTNINSQTQQLTVTGYVPSATSPKAKKIITIDVSKGVGASFYYGMQIGNGGLTMNNNSILNGSIYSNGNIYGDDGVTINGDVWVAGGTQPTADQQSDCTDPNCQDYIFGTNVSGNNILDVAQSFKPSVSSVLNKVSLKLRKIGTPPDETVKILGDSSGKPNKNNVLATGTLSASLVTNTYGFIDVSFSTSPNLTANTTYWIMIATSGDANNYWAWSNDTSQGYVNGSPAWSSNWSAKYPVWTPITGDLGFQTYMGGVITSVSFSSSNGGSVITGNVHAHTITNATINGSAYYQIITNSTVSGTSYPGSADPPPTSMPISDANISSWKSQAANGGITSGNVSFNGTNGTLGPGEIQGNLSLSNGATVTVKSPLWITGNLTLSNSSILQLDSSSGAASGIIIVDGTTSLQNGVTLEGDGTNGSFLVLVSTYNSEQNNVIAINCGNSSSTQVMYAPYGIINVSNNGNVKELTGWEIVLNNNVTLTYDTGLASLFFSSGPSGSFALVKGTYQIK